MNWLKKVTILRLLILASNLVKKAGYNSKSSEIEKQINDHNHSNKYSTTQGFNKLTSEKLWCKIQTANLASKNDIANFVKKTYVDEKLINNIRKIIFSAGFFTEFLIIYVIYMYLLD